MKDLWTAGLVMIGCLACADRTGATYEFPPTAQEICADYCEFADLCWHEEEVPNPFADDIDGCVAECRSLDAAWADDPWGRPECAGLIDEMRRCALAYEHCEAFDDAQLDGRWGPDARCAEEVQAMVEGHCDIPDPRNDP